MTNLADFDVLLMLDREKRSLFPFSTHGFTVTQDPVERTFARSKDLLFLNAAGKLMRIDTLVEAQSTMMGRMLSHVGLGAIKIETTLTEAAVPLDEFKALVIDAVDPYQLQLGGEEDDWALMNLPSADVKAQISAAASFAELYRTMDLPPPEACLDLL